MLKLPYQHTILTLCTFLCINVNSQTIWQDAFADSNFTQNPAWTGDTASFNVNANKKLQLNAPAVSSKKIIQTPSSAIWDATWEFSVHMDFNPSSNNYCRVYFAATDANLSSSYFIQLGGSSDDKIFFYSQQGSQKTKLLESNIDWLDLNQVDVKIKVQRNPKGVFEVWADTSNAYQSLGSVVDSSIMVSQYFAWECIYTSTRSTKFYIDDISVNGNIFTDNIPPEITSAQFINPHVVEVNFTEAIDSATAVNTSSYLLSQNYGAPDQITFTPPAKVTLMYNQSFTNATYQFKIEKVKDLFGNEILDTTLSLDYFSATWGDVLFSEIMFDPSPPVQLPEAEYLEIYNRSEFDIYLDGWEIILGNKKVELAGFTLKKKSYLLVADSTDIDKFSTQNKIGVNWPSSFLTNSGGVIYLQNKNGTLIHYVEYSTELFDNANKADGGWSLENTNVNLPCFNPLFWTGSKNVLGGTPGMVNSQNSNLTDSEVPFAKYLVFKNPLQLLLRFSERTTNLLLDASLPIDSIITTNKALTEYLVSFSSPMQNDKLYQLIVQGGLDCANNSIFTDTLTFGIPQKPDSAQILLNEILFNPSENNTDFIEIYYTGNTCIALNNLRLAQVNEVDGFPDYVEVITLDSVILPPQEFWVFTEDYDKTISYHKLAGNAKVFETTLPSMPQSSGSIGVCTSSLEWLDFLKYNENWHHELLDDPTDVSLERVFLQTSTQSATNWQSASYFKSYATPTVKNSQAGNFSPSGNISLSSDLITPNNDGIEDWVSIQFDLDKPGWVANIDIFDGIGRPRKVLVNNKMLGLNNSIIWDAKNDKGSLVHCGIYIVLVELWHPDGEQLVFKDIVKVHYE